MSASTYRSTEEQQQYEERLVLESIYAEDFIKDVPQPKAWGGAQRLPVLGIRVAHPDPALSDKVHLELHATIPRTYPTLACPSFSIHKPSGLDTSQVTKLNHAIHAEATRLKQSSSVMIMDIVTFTQEWLGTNIHPRRETESLALEMNKRALNEEQLRKQKEADEHERAQKLAQEEAARLEEQIRQDAARQQLAKEQQRRQRANSDSTEVPSQSGDLLTDFSRPVEVNGVKFTSVNMFHPRKDGLGTVYLADPVCDDDITLPLELTVITFSSHYYTTTQGRKKLKQVEAEIQQLIPLRHANLTSIFAVKLSLPHSSGSPKLVILAEQFPALTLHDVLQDSEGLKEERASEYLAQLLAALNEIHAAALVHRGINLRSIALVPKDPPSRSKQIKLGKAAYYTRLLDLHRSDPFGPDTDLRNEEPPLPDSWLSNDIVNSPLLYTRSRDLHALGIVLLKMLLGGDVTERYPTVHDALKYFSVSPNMQRQITSMLIPLKKNTVSCLSLLGELAETSFRGPTKSPVLSYHESRTPMGTPNMSGSPEMDYFKSIISKSRQSSRWKDDWEELELLGRGAFGSVVKARNKIDSRIYAVKKIRLRTEKMDSKIFREVNALSRLSHRFIVRYYTTWVEESDGFISATSSDNESDSDFGSTDVSEYEGLTSVPFAQRSINGISVDLDDLDEEFGSGSRSSFPSIHFSRSSSPYDDSSGDTEEASEDVFELDSIPVGGLTITTPKATQPPKVTRTLYIQMEFVERQTLKERIAEGVSEDEAWRLFQQLVDALVHMSTLGILHRDIKLTNIFIDGNGDCKVGDFGLATSSLAAVDPNYIAPCFTPTDEMTLEVGTRLYIAPEVLSKKRGPRNHSKADMYSLGIVFFEMNFFFSTGAERIAVIENLRQPSIVFPDSWEPQRTRQAEIIKWLLRHEPDERPTALELSQSSLLPQRLEEEYFKGALRMMTKVDSPHHQAVLTAMFDEPRKASRGFLYDTAEAPEHTSLNYVAQERLIAIFQMHGAIAVEPPLLMPCTNPEEARNCASFIDRHGDLVVLPSNNLVPFARLAARINVKRIKRYHISDVYKPNPIPGHPKVSKAAVFDIITPDVAFGPVAASAEVLALTEECLLSFPNLAQLYDINISHATIIETAFQRITPELRPAVTDILNQTKSSPSQKRALLLKKGLLRSTADELEVLSSSDEDVDAFMARIEKVSPALHAQISPSVEQIKSTIQYAKYLGLKRSVLFKPLMLGNYLSHFKDGVVFEAVRRNKKNDVLAVGGRYDSLISHFSILKTQPEYKCAVGVQISVERVTAAIADHQSISVSTLIKEQRSFGFWSPRRCDVYVVSYHPGFLQTRLEVVAHLWANGISADLVYESGLPDMETEDYVDVCSREGILFTVYPRPRSTRREQAAFKVKSILKGTEYELSKHELVSWLQHQIAEQKRVDMTTSGAPLLSDNHQTVSINKEPAPTSSIQLVLPADMKKQRKNVKQIFQDRAFETAEEIRGSVLNGLPVIAVDVAPVIFDAMTRTSAWITDDDAWRSILALFPSGNSPYAQQVRDTVIRKKAENPSCGYALLFAVKEERMQLLKMT